MPLGKYFKKILVFLIVLYIFYNFSGVKSGKNYIDSPQYLIYSIRDDVHRSESNYAVSKSSEMIKKGDPKLNKVVEEIKNIPLQRVLFRDLTPIYGNYISIVINDEKIFYEMRLQNKDYLFIDNNGSVYKILNGEKYVKRIIDILEIEYVQWLY